MPERRTRPGVAVLTTGDEPSALLLAALLRQTLALRGLRSSAGAVPALLEQGERLAAWVRRRRSGAVVCLLTPPYDESWHSIMELQESRLGVPLVLLAADAESARAATDRADVRAITGRADELDEIAESLEALVTP